MLKAPAYSSKPPIPALSIVMMPNEERNTHFGLKFHARPRRGWKLFRSRLPIGPFGCVIAPILPLTGSIAAGSHCDCCYHLGFSGDEYDQPPPLLILRLGKR